MSCPFSTVGRKLQKIGLIQSHKCERIILFLWGYFYIQYKKQEIDISLYPYFELIDDVKEATVICNHTAFVDIMFFLAQSRPVCFISNEAVKNYPFVGIIAKTIQCVFVNRISKESRAKCFEDLKERVKNAQENPKSRFKSF